MHLNTFSWYTTLCHVTYVVHVKLGGWPFKTEAASCFATVGFFTAGVAAQCKCVMLELCVAVLKCYAVCSGAWLHACIWLLVAAGLRGTVVAFCLLRDGQKTTPVCPTHSAAAAGMHLFKHVFRFAANGAFTKPTMSPWSRATAEPEPRNTSCKHPCVLLLEIGNIVHEFTYVSEGLLYLACELVPASFLIASTLVLICWTASICTQWASVRGGGWLSRRMTGLLKCEVTCDKVCSLQEALRILKHQSSGDKDAWLNRMVALSC